MFKKSLAAIAVLGTAAGFACAADVTLYGVVDEGFVFNQTKVEKATGATEKTNSFGLESGVSASSRFGLKISATASRLVSSLKTVSVLTLANSRALAVSSTVKLL